MKIGFKVLNASGQLGRDWVYLEVDSHETVADVLKRLNQAWENEFRLELAAHRESHPGKTPVLIYKPTFPRSSAHNF